MSATKSSSRDTETPCVSSREKAEGGSEDSADKNGGPAGNGSSKPDSNVRQRVLKEVGLTSTTFIGPVFTPNSAAAKSDIEDSLNEFYKELEKIDTADNPEKQEAGSKQRLPPQTSSSNDVDVSKERVFRRTDGRQKSSGRQQPSWPHWHQNEPYPPRGPGSELRSARAHHQRHHPPALDRPPNPRFDRPPLHCPTPPYGYPDPHEPRANHGWSGSGMASQYEEECRFGAFSRFPPPDVCRRPSQGTYGDSPHRFDGDGWGRAAGAFSDDVNIGWSRDGREEWNGDYDVRQRYDSASEQRDRLGHPPRDKAWDSSLVLILMRGLPGSGKSTLARELLSTAPSGLILSTDDYFAYRNDYRYEPELLGAAHEWNQRRAIDAMHDGRSPIIIDNTNIQAWEMKPYVRMALDRGYKVDFCEPDTSWKFDPHELEKRNRHGVPQEKIAQMLDRFSFPISVDVVLSSQEPLHVNQRQRPEQPIDFH